MIDKMKSKGVLSKYSLLGLSWTSSYNSTNGIKVKYSIPSRANVNGLLYLTVRENSRILDLSGNLRKWWFGDNAFSDFSYGEYLKCMKSLARVLDADIVELLDFKIRMIELGVNVRMHRKYAKIIPAMKSFPRLTRRELINGETVKFNGEKQIQIVYDKLTEVGKRQLTKKPKKNLKKLTENNFVLRYENVIKSRSGVKIRNEISTFLMIMDNWNFIADYIIEQFHKIEVVEDYLCVKDKELVDMNYVQIRDLFLFLFMEKYTIVEVEKLINKIGNKHRSDYKKKFRGIYTKHLLKENNEIKSVVSNELVKRVVALKKHKSIKSI
ncbi:MAG TPA: phage/plasmid replication protein [Flavobacteriaceae bacterium]|nr:phage/plasmid replication protein [Flavobacteriaceae bacterium]